MATTADANEPTASAATFGNVSSASHTSNVGKIVAGVVCAVVGSLILAALLLWILRRRKHNQSEYHRRISTINNRTDTAIQAARCSRPMLFVSVRYHHA